MENLNSTQTATFIVTNTGTASGSWGFQCTAGNHEFCGTVTPPSMSLNAGASAAVAVTFTTDQNAATSSLTLYANGVSNDYGSYVVNNALPPPGPNYAVTVTPDGATAPTWLANTSGHVALVTVWNTGTTQDAFDITCAGSGTATCPAFVTSFSLKANSTATVAVTYSVGAAGSGVLTVTASGSDGLEHDNGSYNVTAVAPVRSVTVLPDGQPLSVSAGSIDTLSFQVKNTGVISDTFALTCVVTANGTCGTVSPSTLTNVAPGVSNSVTVTFTAGGVGTTGTVWLRAVNNGGVKDSGSYVVSNTYFAAVTPDGAAKARLASRAYTDTFTVRNPGTTSTTYTITASCSGSAVASGCTPSPTSLPLAGGASGTAAIAYTTGTAGSTGQVKLIATANGAPAVKDSGWANLTIGTAQAPVLDVASANPGTTRERGLCLTFAAGAVGAAECGDLRVVHPLPGTRTLNKLRAPTLLYNSAEAKPYPLVAATVTLPATAATPDTVSATLTINSTIHGRGKWPGADWTPGSVRRIVLADTTAPATGIYSYTLAVTNQWNGSSSLTQSATGQIAVVDRRQSPFGAGWWLAGVERLYTGTMLWVGGDGSTRQYTSAGANVWGAPNLDRPDTIKFDGTRYTRYLPHGVRVQFDGQGRHIATINRLSDTTRFTYGGGDTLITITLPRTGHAYQFTYTSGSRWIVTAPSTPNQTRGDTATIALGRVTSLAGPDNTRLTLGYAPGADSNLIVRRTDRRGFITTYGYDGGKRLVQASIDMGPGQAPIAKGWQPLETVGFPQGGSPRSVDTALAHVTYDGPRVDGWDTTAFWLDRFGAPRRIVNAFGYQTAITRADPRWPALATQLQGPTGLVTQATYDSLGNVLTVTQVNPLGDGRDAITSYTWDTKWAFVKSITLPEGEITQFAYDTGNGNRLWQQPGVDVSRRVTFNYSNAPTAFRLLSSVVYPTSPATRDSIMYDALGNVDSTRTPLGFVTYALKDAIGRDTLTKSPLDVARQRTVRQRMVYDVASQDTLNVAFSDSTSDSLLVRKRYDQEGNNDRVIKKSSPDPAAIGWMTHVYAYDRAGRKSSEQLVGMDAIPFRYDLAGNLTNGGRQGGDNVTVSYDLLNRPVYRSGADFASFSYDTLGNIVAAINSAAQIGRSYYRNGALRTDTLRLATDYLPAQDFSKHINIQRFGYDLDGRRLWAIHPAQLGPTTTDSVAYAYDLVFGQLSSIRDVFGNTYTFTYDSIGRQRVLTRLANGPSTVVDTLRYDADSRLVQRVIRNSAGLLRQENLVYDARNKVLNETLNSDGLTYVPLGALKTATLAPAAGYEGYTLDALGNRTQMVHTPAGADPDNYRYATGTGLMQYREEIRHSIDHDTTFYWYDGVGQLYQDEHRHYWQAQAVTYTEFRSRFSIYDAERRLAQTRFFLDSFPHPPNNANYFPYLSTETYRYDPLGRRVYAREVRGPDCFLKDRASGCLSTLTRTIWDGDQILYETRTQGDSGFQGLDEDVPVSQDFYGVVGYLHAGGVDQPLALWKGTNELVLPYANWRGQFVKATCPTADCLGGVFLPANGATAFGDPPFNPYTPTIWHGSLLEAGTDASGYQYKRNRHYDPSSGRFTQEDPIGLAGGLNLYGFAGGDPVTFSDPFGLCPPPLLPACAVMLGVAVFGGTRIAYNAATNQPLDEGLQSDVARGAFVGAGTGALATAVGSAVAADATATAVAGSPAAARLTVQFGRVANQVAHTFRHIDHLGLNRETVKAAVLQDLQGVASQLTPGKPLNQVIEVEGVKLQYTAYQLANGVVNVGRINEVH
jgi:RHS repeat-associated protein